LLSPRPHLRHQRAGIHVTKSLPRPSGLPAEYTAEDGRRTLALNEILVRQQWRGAHGKGAAHALHEELLSERQEQRVTLLVNPLRSDGRLKAVYEAWGYKQVGSQQPFADSPVFASMMRDPLR
jgi:hypothetical protein